MVLWPGSSLRTAYPAAVIGEPHVVAVLEHLCSQYTGHIAWLMAGSMLMKTGSVLAAIVVFSR